MDLAAKEEEEEGPTVCGGIISIARSLPLDPLLRRQIRRQIGKGCCSTFFFLRSTADGPTNVLLPISFCPRRRRRRADIGDAEGGDQFLCCFFGGLSNTRWALFLSVQF